MWREGKFQLATIRAKRTLQRDSPHLLHGYVNFGVSSFQSELQDLSEEYNNPFDSPQISASTLRHAKSEFFVGTSNSSNETRTRAKALANDIGCFHIDLNMDAIASAFTSLFTSLFPFKKLRFKSEGGSNQESLALQNIQSRSRMVLSYLLASTLTWVRDRRNGGNLLVYVIVFY